MFAKGNIAILTLLIVCAGLLSLDGKALDKSQETARICWRLPNTALSARTGSSNSGIRCYSDIIANLTLAKTESNYTKLEVTTHACLQNNIMSLNSCGSLKSFINITINSDNFGHFCRQEIYTRSKQAESRKCELPDRNGTNTTIMNDSTNTTTMNDSTSATIMNDGTVTDSPGANLSQLSCPTCPVGTPGFVGQPHAYWIAMGVLSLLVLALCGASTGLAISLHRLKGQLKNSRTPHRVSNNPISLPIPPSSSLTADHAATDNITICNVIYDEVTIAPKPDKRSNCNFQANRINGDVQAAKRIEKEAHRGGPDGTLAVCTGGLKGAYLRSQTPSKTASSAALYHTLEECSRYLYSETSSPRPAPPIYHVLELGSAHTESDEDNAGTSM